MPKLIDRHRLLDGLGHGGWITFTGNAADIAPGSRVLLPLNELLEYGETWRQHVGATGALGARLTGADDPASVLPLLDDLALIAVEFPSFADGRGYSIATLLRTRHHYRGELRAVGDVLRDQLFLMARAGFDTFALRDDQHVDRALAAFRDFSVTYQLAADRTLALAA